MNKKRLGIFLGSIALLIVCSFAAYQYWLAPTRILIINATLAQAADIALNNDCARIEVTCIKKEEVKDLSGYDAIVMYSRGLYLDDGQIAEVERVGASGVPVFTNTLRNFTLSLNHNVTNNNSIRYGSISRTATSTTTGMPYSTCATSPLPTGGDTRITSLPSHCWRTCSTTANTAATSVLRKR